MFVEGIVAIDLLNVCLGAGGASSIAGVLHTWSIRRATQSQRITELERDKAIDAKLKEALATNDAATLQIQKDLVALKADQFGSNHGGLREQVDNIAKSVQAIAIDVATLKGAQAARSN
jgi:hypothetical protein